MTVNDLFYGGSNVTTGDDYCCDHLADASLRPQMIRLPPPLFLSSDGDELHWLNPVDCEECLVPGDLEFVFDPRMCVESKASSLTEARRLMHKACKGMFVLKRHNLTIVVCWYLNMKYLDLFFDKRLIFFCLIKYLKK